MSGDSFVHLHVHTEYSMLDGAARLTGLFDEVNRLEMPAIAMTDHGYLYGAYEFHSKATAAGVKPIIGLEAYVAPESRHVKRKVSWSRAENASNDDDVSGGGAYTHMTLFAEDETGLHNLFRLASYASLEGFYRKPRIDRELLARHSKGIIGTTGCPGGEIPTRIRSGDLDGARRVTGELVDILGRDNLFVEVMDHGLDVEAKYIPGLLALKDEFGLRPLATNDLHYTHEEDAHGHDVLLCVQTASTFADPKRFKFGGSGYYVKTAEEMRALWGDKHGMPEACDNTLLIADRVGSYGSVFEPRNLMPAFEVPDGETEASWLRKRVDEGLAFRFRNRGGVVPEQHRKQADFELDVICQMGYPGYFLVVEDLIRHAREHDIRVGPGRGSAAGCLIAWALRITELDPIEHKLIFERFLNPDRVSMPDIDIDFDERKRGDMIRYATQRYGEERVAQIVTYSTIKAKAAIKDSARVLLGQPGYSVADKISKAMPPPVMGKDIPLSGIFDPAHKRYSEAVEVRALYETDPQVKEIIDTARDLEGLKRQAGVHAAGVILSKDPLIDVLPIWRREADGAVITQWDMGACEDIGLLKMDFLGLRNLTVIDDALHNITGNGKTLTNTDGTTIEVLEELALDDTKCYELLSRGDTLGVFQLDGGPMRDLLRRMEPNSFEDISAVIALYRPGPMGANAHTSYADRKNNREPITAIHPELEEPLREILGETYGLIVYQEQVMAIAQQLAGYTLGKADLLRRAMGKKKKEILDREYVPFRDGMKANGYSDNAIKTLWDILVPFSDYAFNRAHTAGYGLVAYWTGFLKANYPPEYMAALLTSVRDDKDKAAVYLAECRKMNITVLPPDVNSSVYNFAPVGENIRFGLGAIRNVGANVVEAIVAARKEKGEFADFSDFLRKVDAVVCNKKVIESLIKAGAFDTLGHPRKGLHTVHADAIDSVMGSKRNEAIGQFDLFGDLSIGGDDDFAGVFDVRVPDEEWDTKHRLALEREMLGLYVSGHPLHGVEQILSKQADTAIPTILEGTVADGAQVTVGGILASVTRRVNRNGEPWASGQLEDLTGGIEVLFFPKTYSVVGMSVAEDAIVLIKARVAKRDERISLIVNDLVVPDLSNAGSDQPVKVIMPAVRCTPPMVAKLKDVLTLHPGTTEVQLSLVNGQRRHVLTLDDRLRVTPTPALMGDLKALLGPGCLG